jgi:hypothetical protein
MSYMRDCHPLRWFEGTTDAYVWEDLYGRIEDYGGLGAMSDASFCELVGRFVDRSIREDGPPAAIEVRVAVGPEFPLELVTECARRTGCAALLRPAFHREPCVDLAELEDAYLVDLVARLIERHLVLQTAGPRTLSATEGGMTIIATPDHGFVRRMAASLARRLARAGVACG